MKEIYELIILLIHKIQTVHINKPKLIADGQSEMRECQGIVGH